MSAFNTSFLIFRSLNYYDLKMCAAAVVTVPLTLELVLDITVELVLDGNGTNDSVCVAFAMPGLE